MSEHLAAGEAHVWSVRLDASGARMRALRDCLSPEEKGRLDACATEEARRRFAVGRGTLRHILARYTGRPAHLLRLLRGELGKPHLEGQPDLHFSMTHSRELALVAVARTEVGIDLEHQRTPARLGQVARRVLHEDTVALLEALDGTARRDAFLEAWTLREAHVKAVGGGMFRTPDTLPLVQGAPEGEPRVLQDRHGSELWSVVRLTPAPGFTAALVARGQLRQVTMRAAPAPVHSGDAADNLSSEEAR